MKTADDQHGNTCGNTPEQSTRPNGNSWGCVRSTPPLSHGAESNLSALGFTRPDWFADALCKEYPHLDFMVERGKVAAACLQVCGRCLALQECRTFAVNEPDLVGIWGGTDSQARRAMRRQTQQQKEQS